MLLASEAEAVGSGLGAILPGSGVRRGQSGSSRHAPELHVAITYVQETNGPVSQMSKPAYWFSVPSFRPDAHSIKFRGFQPFFKEEEPVFFPLVLK